MLLQQLNFISYIFIIYYFSDEVQREEEALASYQAEALIISSNAFKCNYFSINSVVLYVVYLFCWFVGSRPLVIAELVQK